MIIDRRLIDRCAAGNLAHRGAVETVFGEHVRGMVEERLAGNFSYLHHYNCLAGEVSPSPMDAMEFDNACFRGGDHTPEVGDEAHRILDWSSSSAFTGAEATAGSIVASGSCAGGRTIGTLVATCTLLEPGRSRLGAAAGRGAPPRPAGRRPGSLDLLWRGLTPFLKSDRSVHKKQRHTAHRIFERLRDEQGFRGGYTIVREYVAAEMLRTREMFVPLSHCPGHAQADFGEADGYIGGKRVRLHYFCVDLPHSDGCFVKAYPAETAEASCDGHVAAFDFFGGVPQSILYTRPNWRLKIVNAGRRLRSKMFAELQSHYLFEDRLAAGKAMTRAKWKVWSALSGAIS